MSKYSEGVSVSGSSLDFPDTRSGIFDSDQLDSIQIDCRVVTEERLNIMFLVWKLYFLNVVQFF